MSACSRLVPITWLLAALAGCGVDERLESPTPMPGFDPEARAELEASGVGKYLGKFTADEVVELANGEVGYSFAPRDDGPTCIYGDPFRTTVRDMGSGDLLIYLEGGGACWSDLCAAKTNAGLGVFPIGWTDRDLERNPLAGFDVLHVSYCDGSVFSGDNLVLAADGSIERRHRGLANLSASLDVATSRFPQPKRILLAGSSAGGYGTILGTALVRLAYPTTPLFVLNDAGIGLTNPDDSSVVDAALDEWKIGPLIPASCHGCLETGQFTSVVEWGLARDPTLRVSDYSSYEDEVIAGVFLRMEGKAFHQLLLRETDKLRAAHPRRFNRFFVDGGSHTALLAGTDRELDGTRLIDWVVAMLDDHPSWRDLLE
jgi:hypothetical protein